MSFQPQHLCSSCLHTCTLVCKDPSCDRPLSCEQCFRSNYHRTHGQPLAYRDVVGFIQSTHRKDQYHQEIEKQMDLFTREISKMKQDHYKDLKMYGELDDRETLIYKCWKLDPAGLTGNDFAFLQQKANLKFQDKDTVVLETLKLNFRACLLKIKQALSDFVSFDRFNQRASQKHLGFAKNYFQNGQTFEALREYKKARNYYPHKFQSHFQIGWLQEGINKTDSLSDAVKSYKLAHLLDKNNFRVNNNLGQLLALLGRQPEEAINYLTKSISLQEDWRSYATRAKIYESLARLEQAESDYAKVVQMKSQDEYKQKLAIVQNKIRVMGSRVPSSI